MIFKNKVWLLVALAVAFGLRVYLLANQSLWNDEGTSVALAALNLDAIARGAAHDIHPPLYYFLLHFWMGAAGQTEFAVRFLSVLAGTLLVAIMFRLARSWFDEEIALIAAFLSALSTFELYYSQETRMYISLALWGALSVYALYRGWFSAASRRTRLLWGAAYVLTTIAALYTHYFSFALLLFENVAIALLVLARWGGAGWAERRAAAARSASADADNSQPAIDGSTFLRATSAADVHQSPDHAITQSPTHLLMQFIVPWALAELVIAAAFLPWLAFAGNQLTSWPAISEPFTLPDLVGRAFTAFATGNKLTGPNAPWVVAAYAFFFLGGFVPSPYPRQNRWPWVSMAALWTVVPVLTLYVLSLQRPAYNAKFLLVSAPGFYLVVARGLSVLYPGLFLRERYGWWARVRFGNLLRMPVFIMAAVLSVGLVLSLQGEAMDPTLARDDYRTAISYINRVATAEDAVLVNAPGQMDVVKYYLQTQAEVSALPVGRPLNEAATLQELDRLIAGHRRLYALLYATEQSDPGNVIGARLQARGFPAGSQWLGDLRLAQYGLPALMKSPTRTPVGAQAGGEIALDEYTLGSRVQRPGDILPVIFDWRAVAVPAARYKVFLHLLDGSGRVAAQHDAEPFDGVRPTTGWRAGETLRENFGVALGLDLAPGAYTLEFGLYRIDDGQRLEFLDAQGKGLGDHLSFGEIEIR